MRRSKNVLLVSCILVICILFNTVAVFADTSDLDYSTFISKFEELTNYNKGYLYSIQGIKDYVNEYYNGSADIDTLLNNLYNSIPSNYTNYFFYIIFENDSQWHNIWLYAFICDSDYPIAGYGQNALRVKYYQSSFGGSSQIYRTSNSVSNFGVNLYEYEKMYFPTGSFFYDSDGNKYINSYGGEEFTIINIAYPNTRNRGRYITDTGFEIYNNVEDSPYYDTYNQAPSDSEIIGGTRSGSYYFMDYPYATLKYDQNNDEWYIAGTTFRRSANQRTGEFTDGSRSGGYSLTPTLQTPSWSSYRNANGLQVYKNTPMVLREGAMLYDQTNNILYVNDENLPVDNNKLITSIDQVYSLLQSWLYFDVKSWASIYTALNGISESIESMNEYLAATYFELSSMSSPTNNRIFDTLYTAIQDLRYSIGMQYDYSYNSQGGINVSVPSPAKLSVIDSLSRFYYMFNTFNSAGTQISPTYTYESETFTNPIYWIYRDLANVSNNSNYTAQGIDQIIDKMDELFVDVPDNNDTLLNILGDNSNPISLKPSTIITAHQEMEDAISFFSIDRPNTSFLAIFSDPVKWGFFSELTYTNCGMELDEGE